MRIRLYGMKSAADYLGVSAKTVMRVAGKLELSVSRLGSKHKVIFTESQLQAMRQCLRKAAA